MKNNAHWHCFHVETKVWWQVRAGEENPATQKEHEATVEGGQKQNEVNVVEKTVGNVQRRSWSILPSCVCSSYAVSD